MTSKILLVRILGNDLEGLHGAKQTLTNLKFTLHNEATLPNITKMYILNRIVDRRKKKELQEVLEAHNVLYIDIPYVVEEFNTIPEIPTYYRRNFEQLNFTQKCVQLYRYNLYLVNNNASRNRAIQYGIDHGFDWIFPFDSNNFLSPALLQELQKTIDSSPDLKYLIIPQKRLKDGNIPNESMTLTPLSDRLFQLPTREPQIAFHRTCKHLFNPNIPYGFCPKAELLNALHIQGEWNNWKNLEGYFGLRQRSLDVDKTSIVTTQNAIYRLNPFNPDNCIHSNFHNRIVGVYSLAMRLFSRKGKML